MTKIIYKNNHCKTDPSTYGGLIYPSDFNTDYRKKDNKDGSPIAMRIEAAKRFDEQCRKFISFGR